MKKFRTCRLGPQLDVPIEIFCSNCSNLRKRVQSTDLSDYESFLLQKECRHCSGTQIQPIPLCEFFDEE